MNRNAKLSLFDAFCFSLMTGAGETYIPAFVLFIGLSEVASGLVATIPLAIGSFLQLISPFLLSRFKSIKKWVVWNVTIQAFIYLPLSIFALAGYPTQDPILLYLVLSLNWMVGFSAAPSWNYWMNYLIPNQIAPSFFSERMKWLQVGTLLGLVGAGYLLHIFHGTHYHKLVYAFVFFVAFLARAMSAYFLSKLDYESWWISEAELKLKSALLEIKKSEKIKNLLLFIFLFYFSVFISSPFVAPFLLKKLSLSYFEFMIAGACLFLGKIIATPFVRSMLQKKSVHQVFIFGAWGLSPLPILWLWTSEVILVSILQFVSGVFWAFFEVSLTMLFFEKISMKLKISVMTVYFYLQSTALVIGSIFGAWYLRSQSESTQAYYILFVLGPILRLLVVYCFRRPLNKLEV